MTRPVFSSVAASEELTEAIRWYEAQRPGLGGELFDAISDSITLIESQPSIGTPLSADNLTRRILLNRFPYQLVYRLRPEDIVIVAIAHLKRRPGYWAHRK